ncbi:DUF2254 domain-containing protein [Streptomyces sp. NPDC056773]|uniref:DUF2254 domain-containing protein n=1 Tax=unclassified Streptomyces TaxID=2593676 RepID=UPI0036B44CA4
MASKTISARRPLPRLRKRLRSSFLFAPTLGLVCGWLLATGALAADTAIFDLDERLADVELSQIWFLRAAEDLGASVKTAAGTMAAGMLTFIGVVFSITLVALQMAGQFSPRVLRLYVQSRVTKTTFALFLATFLFTLRVQKEYAGGAGGGPAIVPYVGGMLSMGLVVASLLVFVLYVNATIRLMRVTCVMDHVSRESRQVIADRARLRTDEAGEARTRATEGSVRRIEHQGKPGVLQEVHAARLAELARRHDCVLRLLPRIGDFLAPGTPLAEVRGGVVPSPRQVIRCLDLGADRTMKQDVAFGLRQLADIAARALSPAVNDPTTAVQALDHIHVLLSDTARKPSGDLLHTDRRGTVRLIEPVPNWTELADLALTEIRLYGAGSPQLTRRLAAVLDDLVRNAPAEHLPCLERHQRLLEETVRGTLLLPGDQDFALIPNRQGIG